MIVVTRGDGRHVDGAAQVWAEATAARDGVPEVVPLAQSRPVIAEVFHRPGAVLVVGLDDDGQVAAFAVATPLEAHGAERAGGPTAGSALGGPGWCRWLRRCPAAGWGQGVASRMLTSLCAELTSAGFAAAELKVYADNTRAVGLYQKLGFEPSGTAAPHPRTGKPEQRYRRQLSDLPEPE